MKASIWIGALAAIGLATAALAQPSLPPGVKLVDGALADAAGKPLYTWDYDTMAGMSHCEDDCAKMWPPLKAPAGAKPFGDWTPIRRENGALQWTYKTKPLYTFAEDKAGSPAGGEKIPHWRLAR